MATFEEMTKYLDQKKLITILKRFVDTKASAPEVAKYFKVKDNMDFYATDYGCMIALSFENKWKGGWNVAESGTKYVKMDKEMTQYDRIPEYVTIKKGNKKEVLPTGEFVEYPDVEGLFSRFDVRKFGKMILGMEDVDKLIAIHEGIEVFRKVSGDYFACRMMADNGKLIISLNGTEGMELNYVTELKSSKFKTSKPFYYNPSYMVSILKSLKDLKIEKTMMFLNDDDPLLFYTKDIEYVFKFAFNRLLVKEDKKEDEQLGFDL